MGAEMDLADDGGSRFEAYVDGLASVIGHKDREGPLRDYCLGLMLPCERKSVEPLAAVTVPARVAAQHQSLLHFVGAGGWSDERVLAKVREMVLPAIERHGAISAWIIDDTSFPKQGRHSVGVARQYCGQLGKQDNCQVAVSLSLANRHASLPVAWRLYLPQEWADDPARRRKAGVPEDLVFKTKPEIALEQLRFACAAGLPRGVALLPNRRVRTELVERLHRRQTKLNREQQRSLIAKIRLLRYRGTSCPAERSRCSSHCRSRLRSPRRPSPHRLLRRRYPIPHARSGGVRHG